MYERTNIDVSDVSAAGALVLTLQRNGSQLRIWNYELSVLVLPSLEEAYRRSPGFGFCAWPHKPATGEDGHASGVQACAEPQHPHERHSKIVKSERAPLGPSGLVHDQVCRKRFDCRMQYK